VRKRLAMAKKHQPWRQAQQCPQPAQVPSLIFLRLVVSLVRSLSVLIASIFFLLQIGFRCGPHESRHRAKICEQTLFEKSIVLSNSQNRSNIINLYDKVSNFVLIFLKNRVQQVSSGSGGFVARTYSSKAQRSA